MIVSPFFDLEPIDELADKTNYEECFSYRPSCEKAFPAKRKGEERTQVFALVGPGSYSGPIPSMRSGY
jgi:hypothetical protein